MIKGRDRDGHLKKAMLDKDFCPEFPLQIKATKFGNDVVEGAVEGQMSFQEVFRRKMIDHASSHLYAAIRSDSRNPIPPAPTIPRIVPDRTLDSKL